MIGQFELGGSRQRKAAKRSSAAAAYRIEGEYINAVQVAKRLGIHESHARDRLAKARKMDGPVTWERLIALGPKR